MAARFGIKLRQSATLLSKPLRSSLSLQTLLIKRHLAVASQHQETEQTDSSDEQESNVPKHDDYFDLNNLVKLKDLFDARVHLGHHEGCWNQHMKRYIYGTRAHHHIIDLNKTVQHLQLALNVLSHTVYNGGIILFLNTHPRFEYLCQKTARESGEFFFTQRWRGGTLTNAAKMLGRVRLPDLIIASNINSLGENMVALKEAAMCNIPIIGIVDTDCDPRIMTYTIPGNDDTPQAMELYCRLFKTAILKAKEMRNNAT